MGTLEGQDTSLSMLMDPSSHDLAPPSGLNYQGDPHGMYHPQSAFIGPPFLDQSVVYPLSLPSLVGIDAVATIIDVHDVLQPVAGSYSQDDNRSIPTSRPEFLVHQAL